MKKRIVCFICIVLLVTTCCCFFSACNLNLSEEENIERITKKLDKLYFNKDGTPTDDAYFYVFDSEGACSQTKKQCVESFSVEIILAYDEKPEYFLVTYEPASIGAVFGRIMNDCYLLFLLNRVSHNAFDKNGIEKGNRYTCGGGGFVTKINGVMNSIDPRIGISADELYEPLSESYINESLKYSRTTQGKMFGRNYSLRI